MSERGKGGRVWCRCVDKGGREGGREGGKEGRGGGGGHGPALLSLLLVVVADVDDALPLSHPPYTHTQTHLPFTSSSSFPLLLLLLLLLVPPPSLAAAALPGSNEWSVGRVGERAGGQEHLQLVGNGYGVEGGREGRTVGWWMVGFWGINLIAAAIGLVPSSFSFSLFFLLPDDSRHFDSRRQPNTDSCDTCLTGWTLFVCMRGSFLGPSLPPSLPPYLRGRLHGEGAPVWIDEGEALPPFLPPSLPLFLRGEGEEDLFGVWVAGVAAGAEDGVVVGVQAQTLQPGVDITTAAAASVDVVAAAGAAAGGGGLPALKEKDAPLLVVEVLGEGLALREGGREGGRGWWITLTF